jgi:hypothetical protein
MNSENPVAAIALQPGEKINKTPDEEAMMGPSEHLCPICGDLHVG